MYERLYQEQNNEEENRESYVTVRYGIFVYIYWLGVQEGLV